MAGAAAFISGVKPDSIAEELELQPGDRILQINGDEVRDLIDYQFLTADEYIELRVLKADGEEWLMEIEKDYDEDLGLEFEQATFDSIKTCQNRCLFCFVDQMPRGIRDTLNVKDDDYRLSFLQGNFVTLTNLRDADLARIVQLRLSPLYISVHSTNPALREKMLRNKNAGKILKQLSYLKEQGILFHTQIVLCPGLNDGEELRRTVNDLLELLPALQSIAVVPVGLTRHRENLSSLRRFTGQEAEALIGEVLRLQEKLRQTHCRTLLYLSDEFYLLAGHTVPPERHYDDFEQLENGVGLVRKLYQSMEALDRTLPKEIIPAKKVMLATGELGEKALAPVVERLSLVKGLFIETLVVQNQFFGNEVTVAGLITGADIAAAFAERKGAADFVIIPSVMLKKDSNLFLDNMTVKELEGEIGLPVKIADLQDGLTGLYSILF